MKPDHPTIERIRKVRHEISARFGHDPRRMAEYYMELQKRLPPERFFNPREKKPATVTEGDTTNRS